MKEPEVVKWLRSDSGRSKRSKIVKTGAYLIDHDATGRFIVGVSTSVSADVDKIIDKLRLGKHPNKILNRLYEADNMLRVFEYPTTKAKAQAIVDECVATQSTPYLCLNPEVSSKWKKKPKRRSKR